MRSGAIEHAFEQVAARGDRRHLEPDGSGTLVTQEFRTEGVIPAVAAPVRGRLIWRPFPP